jgi:phosphopantothenoylcysteine decarboxylase/phosphopantothenate--cysteine ligase
VRFISNHSSGKMGYALAECAASQGAKVILVSGPTDLKTTHTQIERISVESAQEMYEIMQSYFPKADVTILSAAVADFTPKNKANQKIKKQEGQTDMVIELTKTIDIAKTLGHQKNAQQLVVGFALETENELQNALRKLETKNLDLIILNSMNEKGAGFGFDTNQVTLITREGEIRHSDLKEKKLIAMDILQIIAELLQDLENR